MAPSPTRSKNQVTKAMKNKNKTVVKDAKNKRFSNKLKAKTMKNKKKTPTLKKAAAKKIMKSQHKKPAASKKVKMAATKKSKSGSSKKKTIDAKAAIEDKFNLDMFITKKLGALNTKNDKEIIYDSSSSTLADLVKFNTNLAYSFYNITDMDTLEVSFLAFHDKVDVEKLDLSPSVAEACNELALYKDLLLLGDLPTITQEKRPFTWISSAPSLTILTQVAIMTSFLTLAIKMTGNSPSKINRKMPGGKFLGKKKEEVTTYLAIMQTIVDSMSKGNNWEKVEKFANLKNMETDFNKIIAEF